MNELNEKLAELCGFEWKQVYWLKDGQVAYYHHNAVDCSSPGLDHWHPTTDLNQLKMCYEAAEKSVCGFTALFYIAFQEVYNDAFKVYPGSMCCATAIFKHPELVAQAILKAKDVSL